MSMDDLFDRMMGEEWAKSADFSEIGNSHAGIWTAINEKQAREFVPGSPGKGALLFWGDDRKPTKIPNDSPLMEMCVIFQTDQDDEEWEDDGDDGRREIRMNKKALTSAFRSAVLASGAKKPELGAWWRVTRVENGKPAYKGGNPPWGWHVVYKTPAQFAETGADPASQAAPAKSAVKAGRKVQDDDPFAVPE